MPKDEADLRISNHGSLCLIHPLNHVGQLWLDDNVINDETQFMGKAVACEPRYVEAIRDGADRDGLVVE